MEDKREKILEKMAEREKNRQTFWGNRGVNNAFVIVILITLIFALIPFNRIEERRLNDNGIIVYGQIIGIWQLPEQRSMAIFMFPIDNDVYYTGRFRFPRGYNIHKGNRVRVIYLENRPNVNRALEVLPN